MKSIESNVRRRLSTLSESIDRRFQTEISLTSGIVEAMVRIFDSSHPSADVNSHCFAVQSQGDNHRHPHANPFVI